MTALAVETSGLTRTFGRVRALDGVDLAVPTGVVYGVLGPNGAGKSTTIRILATLLHPTAGTARVLGHDVVREADAVRSRVSLTGQFASVDQDLTGFENLVVLGRLLGLPGARSKGRAHELLEAFGVHPARNRPVKTWSGGMRRRLDLAASIVVAPDLLFLDEPTTGLDPRSRIEVWAIVEALVAEGTTVLLTTQHLDEADQLADRIALIDRGRLVAEGTPGELKSSVGSGVLRVRLHTPDHRPAAQHALSQALDAPVELASDPLALSTRIANPCRAAEAVAALARSGVGLADFALSQPSLDEVFLALTGDALGTDDATGDETT
jgi:ABC-2 type transport system ATP-binding protein